MKEYPISSIIVGRAQHLNSNAQSEQERIQNSFCVKLREEFSGVQILTHNEGFTTKQARFELERAGLPSHGPVDDLSAAIILQDYLDNK